jgi:hypothetical protein
VEGAYEATTGRFLIQPRNINGAPAWRSMYPIRGVDNFVWIYRDNREVWKVTAAPIPTQTSNWPESIQNNLGFIAGRNVGLPLPTLEVRWEVWEQRASEWRDMNTVAGRIECSESVINLSQSSLVPTAGSEVDSDYQQTRIPGEAHFSFSKSSDSCIGGVVTEASGLCESSHSTSAPPGLLLGLSTPKNDDKGFPAAFLESSSTPLNAAMSKGKSLRAHSTASVPPFMIRFEVLSFSPVHAAFNSTFWRQNNLEINGSPVWRALVSFAEPREIAGLYAWMYKNARGFWNITTGNHLDAPSMHNNVAFISGMNVCELPTHEVKWAAITQGFDASFPLQAACMPIHETPAQTASIMPLSSPLMERSQSELDMETALETSRNEWEETEYQRVAEEASLKRTVDMSLATHKPRRGLVNLGNTCYLNSSLQLLVANADLRGLLSAPPTATVQREEGRSPESLGSWLARPFLTRQPSNKLAEMERARALRDVFSDLTFSSCGGSQDNTSFITPSNLHDLLPWPFNGFEQQDADEALHEVLLECLEKGGYGATPTSTSPLTNLYGGEIHRQVTCLACSGVSTLPPEPINALHLPLEGPGGALDNLSITRLINAYFADDVLGSSGAAAAAGHGEPIRRCESRLCRGTRQHALQTTTFHRVPRHLLLALKRFDELGGKKCTPVEIDETLHLLTPLGELILDLYAVIVHSGASPNSGHYFTYARDSGGVVDMASSNDRQQQWYRYDDSQVTLVSKKEWDAVANPALTNEPSEAHGEISNFDYEPTPYILCYRRRLAAGT